MVAATIRTVFVQPDAASARETWRKVVDSIRHRFPRVADLLDEAEANVPAYLAFPAGHWRQIWSIGTTSTTPMLTTNMIYTLAGTHTSVSHSCL